MILLYIPDPGFKQLESSKLEKYKETIESCKEYGIYNPRVIQIFTKTELLKFYKVQTWLP